jgi:hypothetical protein
MQPNIIGEPWSSDQEQVKIRRTKQCK